VKPIVRLPPEALGLGVRPAFVGALRDGGAAGNRLGFVEAIAENALREGSLPRRHLEALARTQPVALHAVSTNLLGPEPLDERHLHALAGLAHALDAPCVTDHLCWTGARGFAHHDLLPAPFASSLVPFAAARIRQVQRALGRPFGVENVAAYLAFVESDLDEWEFVRRVCDEADCGLLLDVNNLYVSSQNQRLDPRRALDRVPWDRVLYAHVAGHEVRPDGLLHDTHDRAVSHPVWRLYAEAWERGGPFATMLEWDESIPSFEAVCSELALALEARSFAGRPSEGAP